MRASRVALVPFALNLLLCIAAAAAEPLKVAVLAPLEQFFEANLTLPR